MAIENNMIVPQTNPPRVSELRRMFKVMFSRWVVTFGAVIILILILVAIFAPLLAPYQ